jgi:hypothetical protein
MLTKTKYRLLYEHGQDVSAIPAPRGRYVYCWGHGIVPRYFGKGENNRWRDHLNTDGNGNRGNRLKRRYFRRFGSQMACYVVEEALSEERQCELEDQKIRQHGLRRAHGGLRDMSSGKRDRSGVLLNDRYATPYPEQRSANGNPEKFVNRLLSRVRSELRGRIAANARLYRITAHNPKKRSGNGWAYIEFVYPKYGTAIRYDELLVKGREHPQCLYNEAEQFAHVTWDILRGILGFEAPRPGETIKDGSIVPSYDWLHKLALEVGSEDEWRAWRDSPRRNGKLNTTFAMTK